MINIFGISKAAVLAALYNNSKPQGLGFLHASKDPLTAAEAAEILKRDKSFDYLMGRSLKIDLSGDSFDPHLYNRDNGQGAAERALAPLLQNPCEQLHK